MVISGVGKFKPSSKPFMTKLLPASPPGPTLIETSLDEAFTSKGNVCLLMEPGEFPSELVIPLAITLSVAFASVSFKS